MGFCNSFLGIGYVLYPNMASVGQYEFFCYCYSTILVVIGDHPFPATKMSNFIPFDDVCFIPKHSLLVSIFCLKCS